MWKKIKGWVTKAFTELGDDFLVHTVFHLIGKAGDKGGEEAGKVVGELLLRAFKGERTKEAWVILINRLKPETWARVVEYFRSNPSDVLEKEVGAIWRACQNGITYLRFNVDSAEILRDIKGLKNEEREIWATYARTQQVKDGLLLFLGTFRKIFDPEATDEDITCQLELFHQAGPWQRFVRSARNMIAERPALARFIRLITCTRTRQVRVHNTGPGHNVFERRQETEEETTARALRRLAIGAACLAALTIIAGVVLLPVLFYRLMFAPVATGGAGEMIGQAFWLSLGIVILAPFAWILMQLAGFRPAARKFWAILAFAVTVGLAVRLLAFFLPIADYPKLGGVAAFAVIILAWQGIYNRLATSPGPGEEKTTPTQEGATTS